MLKLQRFNCKTYGFCTFSHFGLHIQTCLPQDIRFSFKSQTQDISLLQLFQLSSLFVMIVLNQFSPFGLSRLTLNRLPTQEGKQTSQESASTSGRLYFKTKQKVKFSPVLFIFLIPKADVARLLNHSHTESWMAPVGGEQNRLEILTCTHPWIPAAGAAMSTRTLGSHAQATSMACCRPHCWHSASGCSEGFKKRYIVCNIRCDRVKFIV